MFEKIRLLLPAKQIYEYTRTLTSVSENGEVFNFKQSLQISTFVTIYLNKRWGADEVDDQCISSLMDPRWSLWQVANRCRGDPCQSSSIYLLLLTYTNHSISRTYYDPFFAPPAFPGSALLLCTTIASPTTNSLNKLNNNIPEIRAMLCSRPTWIM